MMKKVKIFIVSSHIKNSKQFKVTLKKSLTKYNQNQSPYQTNLLCIRQSFLMEAPWKIRLNRNLMSLSQIQLKKLIITTIKILIGMGQVEKVAISNNKVRALGSSWNTTLSSVILDLSRWYNMMYKWVAIKLKMPLNMFKSFFRNMWLSKQSVHSLVERVLKSSKSNRISFQRNLMCSLTLERNVYFRSVGNSSMLLMR